MQLYLTSLAPPNCLQYHYNLVGQIKSFNFDFFDQGFTYFNNLDYTICFKKESGFCTARFSVPRDDDSESSASAIFGGDPFLGIGSNGGNTYNDGSSPDKVIRPPIKDPTGDHFNIIPGNDVQQGASGAGHIHCPNDYLIINYIRYCGYRLNPDLYGQGQHSQNVPVLGKFF